MSQGPRDEAVIQTPDRRLRVFVSSTLGELAAERRAAARAITALRLTPVMFEAGARPHPPRELYQAYLAQSDVFIGIYCNATVRSMPAWRSRGWRRSSCWPGPRGCRGCCMSRRPRPTASLTWPGCWPASAKRPPTGGSARQRSWADVVGDLGEHYPANLWTTLPSHMMI